MHCLPQSKILAAYDFEAGLIVAIHSVRSKMIHTWFSGDGSVYQKLLATQENPYKGVPMVVLAVNLPFLRAETLSSGFGPVTLDVRELVFMSVTENYAAVGVNKTVKDKITVKPTLFKHKRVKKPSVIRDSKGKPHIYDEAKPHD